MYYPMMEGEGTPSFYEAPGFRNAVKYAERLHKSMGRDRLVGLGWKELQVD